MTKAVRVVLVNEFSDINCPVTKLLYEFGGDLAKETNTQVAQFNLRTKYRPGGMRWQRVVSLIVMHLLTPFAAIYHWLNAYILGQKLCFVVTTLPPLVHWSVILIGNLFGFRVVVWYQDAHPEIESRILQKKGLIFLASGLRAIDRWILAKAPVIVVLDDAMADLLIRGRDVSPGRIFISPPWTTFINPAKPIRGLKDSSSSNLKLLYAGNYGFAHDLSSLAKEIKNLSVDIKTKVSITGIGMNEDSRKLFTEIFDDSGIKISTLPRVESFENLLKIFSDYDLGVVSLHEDYAGIAAPSKAFTYVSQGLPLLYVGPKRTLPDRLTEDGAGYNQNQFIDALKTGVFPGLRLEGLIVTDPKAESEKVLLKAIYAP